MLLTHGEPGRAHRSLVRLFIGHVFTLHLHHRRTLKPHRCAASREAVRPAANSMKDFAFTLGLRVLIPTSGRRVGCRWKPPVGKGRHGALAVRQGVVRVRRHSAAAPREWTGPYRIGPVVTVGQRPRPAGSGRVSTQLTHRRLRRLRDPGGGAEAGGDAHGAPQITIRVVKPVGRAPAAPGDQDLQADQGEEQGDGGGDDIHDACALSPDCHPVAMPGQPLGATLGNLSGPGGPEWIRHACIGRA